MMLLIVVFLAMLMFLFVLYMGDARAQDYGIKGPDRAIIYTYTYKTKYRRIYYPTYERKER